MQLMALDEDDFDCSYASMDAPSLWVEATTRANAREKKLREEMACIRENVEAVMEKARELTSVGDDGWKGT